MSTPPVGLLLDVDGPLASPETRTVDPLLLEDLRRLLAAGIPVVLNTGRSVDFVGERLLGPLVAAGLPDGVRLHAVCEKGGLWTTAGAGEVHVDPELAVPEVCHAVLAELVGDAYGLVGDAYGLVGDAYGLVGDAYGLVGDAYGEAMFVDTGKRTMATVEARTDVPAAVYAECQQRFDADLAARLSAAGLGIQLGDQLLPDADGRTPWRIDPSVIATDVESVRAGKALGASRALDLLRGDGALPTRWHTVGDSRSDYAMADHLHGLGAEVTHVDVGPRSPLDRPYRVRTVPGARYEAAGGAHLRELVARLT